MPATLAVSRQSGIHPRRYPVPSGAGGSAEAGLAADPTPPIRALVTVALAAAAPVLGDHVLLRHGKGREQTVEGGMLVARYPAGPLLRSPTGRCFFNYLELWAGDAVLDQPADAALRVAAVLTLLRCRMARPGRWGAVVMRRSRHHP